MNYSSENQRFLNILAYYLNYNENAVSPQAIEEVCAAGVDKATAFALLVAEGAGLDSAGADREFFNEYFLPSVKELCTSDYYSDAYFQNIAFPAKKCGDFELKYLTAKPYQGFVRDDFIYYPNGKVLPRIGFFPTEYRYPAALQKGREWMTLLPNEINSQKKYVEAAFGKVLTYGLGLGYYVLHVALKDDVRSVTVVDIDENVIRLFKENVLPQFPAAARDKVRIVCKDAFEFAKGLNAGDFDYIYADIWHDVADGVELYKKFRSLEKFCPTAKYGYWIEDTIKYYL